MPDFLSALSPEEATALHAVAGRRRYDRGVTLFHSGDDSGTVLIVLRGQVKVTASTEEGREVILGFCGPGELLGEVSALDGGARSATATALEAVEALGIPGHSFRALIERRPELMHALLRTVAARLRESDRQLVEYAAYDVLRRVARRLVELVDRFGAPGDGGVEITLALSQDELAGWAGASREAISKALHTMRDLGWVETRRRRIVVRDLNAVRRHAG